MFIPAEDHLPIVDEMTKAWLSGEVGDWSEFIPLKVIRDVGAQDRLAAMRRQDEETAPHLSHDQYRILLERYCTRNGLAIPPAISRPGMSVSRYCLLARRSGISKLSGLTYSNLDSVADYFEHRLRSNGGERTCEQTVVYDLEADRTLRYAGNRTFAPA